MTTRELHFRIQERLENLASTASQMSGEQPSQLEIDLLLSKLRKTYDEVLYMKRIALQSFVKQAPKASMQAAKSEIQSQEAATTAPTTTNETAIEAEANDIFTMLETAIHESEQSNTQKQNISSAPNEAVAAMNQAIEAINPTIATEPTPTPPTVPTIPTPKSEPTAPQVAPVEIKQQIQPIVEKTIEQTTPAPIQAKTPIQESISGDINDALHSISTQKTSTPPAINKTETAKTQTTPKTPIAPPKSTHDLLSNYQGAKIQPKAVKNLSAAIGLNDKFQFIRELFGSSSDTFNNTIETINQMNSFEEAHQFLNQHYNWDETDPVVVKFLEMVNRRYIG